MFLPDNFPGYHVFHAFLLFGRIQFVLQIPQQRKSPLKAAKSKIHILKQTLALCGIYYF